VLALLLAFKNSLSTDLQYFQKGISELSVLNVIGTAEVVEVLSRSLTVFHVVACRDLLPSTSG